MDSLRIAQPVCILGDRKVIMAHITQEQKLVPISILAGARLMMETHTMLLLDALLLLLGHMLVVHNYIGLHNNNLSAVIRPRHMPRSLFMRALC